MSTTTSTGQQSREARSAAITAGIALALMAALAPVAVFVALPAGLVGVAALVILLVVILDVIVAIALVPVFEQGGKTLAWITAGLRITYAAVFAVAAAQLFGTADIAAFHSIWDAALLVFGAHLIALAILIWRAAAPKWLAALIAIAALGYAIDAVMIALIENPPFEAGIVTFVGEVVLILWLLIKGGKR